MNPRTFTVPLAALVLSLGQGCTDEIVGDWVLVDLDGEEWPLYYHYNYGTYEYYYKGDASLRVNKALEAEFEMLYEEWAEWGEVETEHTTGEGRVTVGKRGAYAITLEGEDLDLELSCTLDALELACENRIDELDMVFERVDD